MSPVSFLLLLFLLKIFLVTSFQGFLHIDEYPPDANQGFDIPSAVISYPDFYSSTQFGDDKSAEALPILAKFQVNRILLSVKSAFCFSCHLFIYFVYAFVM